MIPARFIFLCVIPFSFGVTSSHAAERVVFHQQSAAVLPQPLFTSDPTPDKLHVLTSHLDAFNIRHTRMQQTYDGVPVHGGYVIVHTPQGQALQTGRVTGALYQHLAADLGDKKSKGMTSGDQILASFKSSLVPGRILEEHVAPWIEIDAAGHAFWAYRVDVLLQPKQGPLTHPTAIIHAQTHAVMRQWDDLKTMHTPVKGVGFSGHEGIGKKQYGTSLPFLDLTRDDYLQQCYMENTEVRVVDLQHDYKAPLTPITFYCAKESPLGAKTYWTGYEGTGYDEINGAFSVANDALYVGHLVKKMYRSYHVDVLKSLHSPLIMRVHYGQTYENAFWDGQTMTFGDGHLLMYPLVSLGIAAHEISHGFTEQYANLEYYGQAGGMNESFSDMAAQAAEYHATAHNTWKIGSEILKPASGLSALRFMDAPSTDGHSIETATQYRRGMDVHYASGVYNRLFYLLSKQWSLTQAFQLMLKANMDYWTPTSSFSEGACGLLQAAKPLRLSIDTLKKALHTVDIDISECA